MIQSDGGLVIRINYAIAIKIPEFQVARLYDACGTCNRRIFDLFLRVETIRNITKALKKTMSTFFHPWIRFSGFVVFDQLVRVVRKCTSESSAPLAPLLTEVGGDVDTFVFCNSQVTQRVRT